MVSFQTIVIEVYICMLCICVCVWFVWFCLLFTSAVWVGAFQTMSGCVWYSNWCTRAQCIPQQGFRSKHIKITSNGIQQLDVETLKKQQPKLHFPLNNLDCVSNEPAVWVCSCFISYWFPFSCVFYIYGYSFECVCVCVVIVYLWVSLL